MIKKLAVFVLGVISVSLLSGTLLYAAPEKPKSPKNVNAILTQKSDEIVNLKSWDASLSELLNLLVINTDAELEIRKSVYASETFSGEIEGRRIDLIRWLLHSKDYLIAFNQEDENKIVSIVVLRESSKSKALQAEIRSRLGVVEKSLKMTKREIAELSRKAGGNRDIKAWLETVDENNEETTPGKTNLFDAPTSVQDILTRRQAPLAGDYDTFRLENDEFGNAPRHLTKGNNAASHTLESALRRTTAMARRNVRNLTKTLERTCVDASCGISQETIDAREIPKQIEKE